ncbi:MAG TPA: 4Fe-4S dicluster domain-containing protein [Lentimicrobium sp.]|nr:4Fe-4S dicluster domain-containing protein [Lentimicrobium sp.]
MEKKYWSNIEVLNGVAGNQVKEDEVHDDLNLLEVIDKEISSRPTSRRNFLKFCGFSFAGAAIASSCENPVKKAIPYLNKPEEVMPGTASHYASTYYDGFEYNSIVVKVRDGRPIKIEGNPLSSVSRGRTTAKVQASILSLYDGTGRIKKPTRDKKEVNFEDVDPEIISRLKNVSEAGQQTVILTSNIIGPATKALINEFLTVYPGKHVMYEPVSASAMLLANKQSLGINGIPDHLFEKAEYIVSFDADFLGTWISPVEFAFRYGQSRDLLHGKQKLTKHYQFETSLSITGSKADERFPVKPSDIPILVSGLYNELAGNKSQIEDHPAKRGLKKIANELKDAPGRSIVISGSNDPNVQIVINAINNLLNNFGNTLDLNRLILTQQAIDSDMDLLVDEMNSDSVGGIILWNCNPIYDYHNAQNLIAGLKKMKITVSMNPTNNETNEHFRYILPGNHYLESWDDAQPKTGIYSLAQPTIRNLFITRQPQDSLLVWLGQESDFYQYLKNFWITNIIKGSEADWNNVLQKGVFENPSPILSINNSGSSDFNNALLQDALLAISEESPKSGIELSLYTTIKTGKGNHANNPWLLELPDPISKISWDNFASISEKTAADLKLNSGRLILVNKISFPVYIQPGQADNTVSIPLGYGQVNIGKVGSGLGENAFKLIKVKNNNRQLYDTNIEISPVEGEFQFAISQKHGSLEGRPIVRETILSKYKESPDAGNELHEEFEKKHVTLYKETIFSGHHWGMGVDLNKCIGCNTCVIACQAENNIPVVGRDEVRKTRIMHWIRIDRYFAGPVENPEVVFQPLPCQHCDNAPCENVCPVSATNHSNEGLNQMAYNRCIGTKYCINNCPYKVRRFNWFRYATNEKFDYHMNSDLGRMVLNPDVTVRERGVVEKCTFCVQRIQAKKLEAKLENRTIEDGEILPACVQSCPADALVFGDLNDPDSKVSKLFREPRNYHLLEELHTLPSVGYLTLVRNKDSESV